jgi:hypothetical protein
MAVRASGLPAAGTEPGQRGGGRVHDVNPRRCYSTGFAHPRALGPLVGMTAIRDAPANQAAMGAHRGDGYRHGWCCSGQVGSAQSPVRKRGHDTRLADDGLARSDPGHGGGGS